MDGLDEPRELSGITTSLIVSYVEREGGREALEEVLELTSLTAWEDALRDETRWFADKRRVDLFRAAALVLEDPEVARHIGESAVDFNTGHALKLALRSLGSPRLIYANAARANAKFNTAHDLTLREIGDGRAVLSNAPAAPHIQHHRFDCQYAEGMLSCAPLIFGVPRARVRHTECIGEGADECVFEVEWEENRSPAGWAIAGLLMLGAGAVLFPALMPVAVAGAALMAVVALRRAVQMRGARTRGLEAEVREGAEAAERMMTSLKALVSELNIDQLLEKITNNARGAMHGAEFALLVREDGHLECRGSGGLPAGHLEAIQSWVEVAELPLDSSLVVEDLRKHPELTALAEDLINPVGAICAAPLVSRNQSLGVLVALTLGVGGFLPRDVVQLESYAAQAALALTNARLYEAQLELAIEDPLTGLYNHRHFHETLARELDRCRRYGDELGVAIFDLNGFKLINDHGGHAEGDRILRRVASALRRDGRRTDIAFRIGGDEFALILPATGRDDAARAAERAATAVDRIDHRLSVSWGVASWPDAGLTKDALLTGADEAMYEMKRTSRRSSDPSADLSPRTPIAGAGRPERLVCTSRLAARLGPMLDPEMIAETVVEELLRSFEFNLVEVLEIDGRRLRRVASGGPLFERSSELLPGEFPVDEGIAGRAVRSGESVLAADTRADPAYVGTGSTSEGRSELVAPIRAGDGLWGVLNLERETTYGFDPDDVLLAETVAAACGAAIHRSQLYGELENAFIHTLAVLCDALEAKDAYTAAHAREVAELAEQVGRELGMGPTAVRQVGYAALLHDIGKIGIDGEILHKPGRLTEAEYEEMKQHSALGARMLERIPFFEAVHPIVRASHERWDGNGYPDRLRDEEIPLGARVISACDAFHAMTSDRPYRRAMSVADACRELREQSGKQFDPEVSRILLGLIERGERTPKLEPSMVAPQRAAL